MSIIDKKLDAGCSAGNTPPALQEYNTLENADPDMQHRLASGPHTPHIDLFRLAKLSDPRVLTTLASNTGITAGIANLLVRKANASILFKLWNNPSLDYRSRAYVLQALHQNLKRAGRASTQNNRHILYCICMAQDYHAEMPLSVYQDFLDIFIQVCVPQDLQVVASNPMLSPNTLARLATHPDTQVVCAVAGHPNLSPGTIKLLSYDPDEGVRVILAARLDLSFRDIRRLSNSPQACVREVVANNPSCPQGILEKLSSDLSRDVRASVALNTATPVHILEKLALDKEDTIVDLVAANLSCPQSLLQILCRHPNAQTRAFVATNPNCPSSILSELAIDSDPTVQAFVASNLSTPEDILEGMAEASTGEVLELLALNPKSTSKVLAGVICNLASTPEILTQAAAHPNCPQEMRILVNTTT